MTSLDSWLGKPEFWVTSSRRSGPTAKKPSAQSLTQTPTVLPALARVATALSTPGVFPDADARWRWLRLFLLPREWTAQVASRWRPPAAHHRERAHCEIRSVRRPFPRYRMRPSLRLSGYR